MEGKTYPDRLTDRQTYRQTTTYIQTDGHTGRWTDRHPLRRTGRQMDRQRASPMAPRFGLIGIKVLGQGLLGVCAFAPQT